MTAIKALMLAILLFPFSTFAGRVRTLPVSSQEMPVIRLMTGRSTVLRFSSTPKKVIIGNQNYFNIEFIDSDVTLQPLANTTSNMFVYGEGFTYGFILKVDHSADYDDLVFVRNKIPSFISLKREKIVSPIKKNLKFIVVKHKNSIVEVQGEVFKWNESVKSFYTDIFIMTKMQKAIPTDSIKIQILSDNQEITTIKPVFEKDQISPISKNRVRLFANVNPKQILKIKLQIEKDLSIFDIKWKN